MHNFLKNYLSTLLFIFILYFIYSIHTHYINFFQWEYSFVFLPWFTLNIKEVFQYIITLYIGLLIPFYIIYPQESKARLVLWYTKKKLINKYTQINSKEKIAFLAWWVKWFFAPLMIFWLTGHIFNMINNIYNFFTNLSIAWENFLYFFNTFFFYMAFSCILFFDVFFFTLWYLIEAPFLKNTIRSVDTTLLWWWVALAAYPPFNNATNSILWWHSTDFPQFTNASLHITMNICILILMGIYSRASMSLWWKASNLTNRWIVTHGPYKYMRHPAYICKNLAWWIGWLPVLIWAISAWNFTLFISILCSLLWWSYIYYLRAKTEEIHLSQDQDYITYRKNVPNMFLPSLKK